MRATTPRPMFGMIDPANGKVVSASVMCDTCVNNASKVLKLREYLRRLANNIRRDPDRPLPDPNSGFTTITGQVWEAQSLPETEPRLHTCMSCGYTDGETQFKLKGLLSLLIDLEDREEDPIFVAYYPKEKSLDGERFVMKLAGINTTSDGTIMFLAEPLEPRKDGPFDGLSHVPRRDILTKPWGVTIKREIKPMFSPNRPRSYGFHFFENGVALTNIYFPNREMRAQFYRENIAPDPDKYFDEIKDFEEQHKAQE